METPTYEHRPQVKLLHSSPLDTLVRRTSSRRVRNQAASQEPSSSTAYATRYSPSPNLPSPPRAPFQAEAQAPPSPLLHSRFRGSGVSASTNNDVSSYLNRKSFMTSLDTSQDNEDPYYDDASMYSDMNDSSSRVAQPYFEADPYDTAQGTSNFTQYGASSSFSGFSRAKDSPYSQSNPPPSPVPTVVVSSHHDVNTESNAQRQGRSPIVAPVRVNYSRPGRPPIAPSDSQKRQVLERNTPRHHSPLASPYDMSPSSDIQTPQGRYSNHTPSPHQYQSFAPSPSSSTGSFLSPNNHLSPYISYPPPTSPSSLTALTSPSQVVLPRQPPSRPHTPASLYSSYSYYEMGSATPSPNGSTTQFPPNLSPTPTESKRSPSPASSSAEPRTPQDYLQLGIQHHESNRLQDSAVCFEKSAKEQGGCGVGMLMWGLTLRHGWGCEKNEKHGFKWLTKAAESAVEDLERAKGGLGADAVKTELVIAIYEVGQCFFQGWGVDKDKKMAVSYYKVAANLGDADAQQDLAFCLANGKGCKKDKKEAAMWYRAAVAQGASDVGLAWIYKDKYKN